MFHHGNTENTGKNNHRTIIVRQIKKPQTLSARLEMVLPTSGKNTPRFRGRNQGNGDFIFCFGEL